MTCCCNHTTTTVYPATTITNNTQRTITWGSFRFAPKRFTDADIFDEYVRETHKIPQDPAIWKKLNVVNVLYHWDKQGFYKANAFDFKDDSSYEGGKVYN